jgi:hypothetical protein
LELKYPVVRDAIKLAVVSPEETRFYDEFGIYEKVQVNKHENILLMVSEIHRRLQWSKVKGSKIT